MLTKRGFSKSIHWLSPEKAAVENISEAEPEEKVSEVDAIDFYTEVEEPEVKEGIHNKKEPVETFWESEEKVSDMDVRTDRSRWWTKLVVLTIMGVLVVKRQRKMCDWLVVEKTVKKMLPFNSLVKCLEKLGIM